MRLRGLRILARMIVKAYLRDQLATESKTGELMRQVEDRPDANGMDR